MGNNVKCINVHVMGVPEGEERNRIFEEIIVATFPSLIIHTNQQTQEAEQIPNRIHTKRSVLRHTIVKL